MAGEFWKEVFRITYLCFLEDCSLRCAGRVSECTEDLAGVAISVHREKGEEDMSLILKHKDL